MICGAGGYHPLTPFVSWGWPAPYTWHGKHQILPVRCKSGLAMARTGSIAHQVTAVATWFYGAKAWYGARWQCTGGSRDVVLLASADSHGGICRRCQDAAAGPCVYRCYGNAGDLLYIGSTGNRSLRIGSHRSQSPWWPEIADIQYQSFPTIFEARTAERHAIETEHPAFNRQWRRAAS